MPTFGTLKYPSLSDALSFVIVTHFGSPVISLASKVHTLW
jgi:hypothetical protein